MILKVLWGPLSVPLESSSEFLPLATPPPNIGNVLYCRGECSREEIKCSQGCAAYRLATWLVRVWDYGIFFPPCPSPREMNLFLMMHSAQRSSFKHDTNVSSPFRGNDYLALSRFFFQYRASSLGGKGSSSIGGDSLNKAWHDFCIAHRFLNCLNNCCNYDDTMAALLKFKVKSWVHRYVKARVSFGSEGREAFALDLVLRVCQMAFV